MRNKIARNFHEQNGVLDEFAADETRWVSRYLRRSRCDPAKRRFDAADKVAGETKKLLFVVVVWFVWFVFECNVPLLFDDDEDEDLWLLAFDDDDDDDDDSISFMNCPFMVCGCGCPGWNWRHCCCWCCCWMFGLFFLDDDLPWRVEQLRCGFSTPVSAVVS